MEAIDIISFDTTDELRFAAEQYQSALHGFPPTLSEVHQFARSYFEAPEELFVTRITPIILARRGHGGTFTTHLTSLMVAVDDSAGKWMLNAEVALGTGAEPATLGELRQAGVPYVESAPGSNDLLRALTENEGRGLVQDLHTAIRAVDRKRSWFSRVLDSCKK